MSKMEKAISGIEATWTLTKTVAVLGIVGYVVVAKVAASAGEEKPADFLAVASPLEVAQRYSLNRHVMPSLVASLPAVTEAERVAHPNATAVQIARAKWMERTWAQAEKLGEPERKVSGSEKSGLGAWLGGVIGEAMGKDGGKPAPLTSMEVAAQQLLVGDAIVPSLASGQLPVFSDADVARYRAEAARQGLNLGELDYRRALWFLTKYGVGSKPAPAPEDLEIRAAESAIPQPKPSLWGGPVERRETAPLSDNEKMAKAVDILNSIYAAPPAAVAAAPKGGK